MNLSKINPEFSQLNPDYLYHLGLDSSMDLHKLFPEIKWVIFTLSNHEALIITNQLALEIYKIDIHTAFSFAPLYKTERFGIYKIESILVISIGAGMPSLLLALNEVVKLLVHSNNYNAQFLKLGLCSGIGLKPGSLIISQDVLNNKLEPIFTNIECGKVVEYCAKREIANTLFIKYLHHNNCELNVANTLSTYDGFIALSDGGLGQNSVTQRLEYFAKLKAQNVKNFDCESGMFAGFCNYLEIPYDIIGISGVDLTNQSKVIAFEGLIEHRLLELSKMFVSYTKS